MIKDKPFHKFSGKIRFKIPNTRYTTNFLPLYSKDACKTIHYSRIFLRNLPPDIQDQILFQVLDHKNKRIGKYQYKCQDQT